MRVDFVANVSHEIRTPLTSIKGYAQLLEAHNEKVPQELQPILQKITGNTERLKDLFENLLRLSKIESQYQIEKQEFDLKEMISKINSQIKGKYLKRSFQIDFMGDQYIYGDPKLLEHAFINLIDNAIKYSDKDLTKIQIVHTKSLDQHLISIKDNGIGLNPEDIQRIFERFYRVQGKTYKAIEGTGLGLSIVKHIVNRHHGEIEVKSEEHVGSEFIIQIPWPKF
jgi:two-component system phosphate regulon sensor histidine kinase PhoR